ncbi:hypothetical protein [Pseudobacteriovorax antillogorgiicola]|uniref:Uncharacterized protein n=1 Tax=Pseudobacteriovorax antillogorgiicola TaxID=1513793 RepID=A0A1Y6BQ44_9BACT|nr:hypothetical protein [Pseudobacteriovorax antillogorgiicola]TCS53759.1 hypothetical protein EDD56_10768 [Pseudobacteriovorax antillogorgiicola]SMF22528.1 hypothetical protein SAMN06296036_107204 [Pseudobacteriovorax antillogorgiicola]
MEEIKLKIDALADAKRQIEQTLPILQALRSDHSKIEQMIEIGDHFNGLIGTFSFGSGTDIFDELVDVARMIDNVCQIYRKDELGDIQLEHLEFIIGAVSYSQILLDVYVREGKIESLGSKKTDLINDYNRLTDVEEREILDQSDIDDLLSDL